MLRGFSTIILINVLIIHACPLVFAAESGALVVAHQEPRYYSAEISHVLEDAQRVASTVAVIVAAVWGYFKFFRGRTYRPRLEPAIAASFYEVDKRTNIYLHYEVKNVGLSKVVIGSTGSGLVLSVPDSSWRPQFAHEVRWLPITAFEILQDHGWIEPGELIQEQRMLALESVYPAVRLQLKLCSPESETVWTAMTIVLAELPSGESFGD